MATRREFVRHLAFAAVPLAMSGPTRQDSSARQGTAPGRGSRADTLAIPLGGTTAPIGPLDNDPGVIAIERNLRCTCGCTLDVYTCRTTDFSCTYSPAMHRDVVAQVQAGATAEQILADFVAKDGEKVLMAPPPRGFNLMGYLLPGFTITALGLALAAWLSRARTVSAVAAPNGSAADGAHPDAEQLARLRRALDDVES